MKKLKKCRKCGAELPKKAKRCPACNAKAKKPLLKRWWFWLLAVIFVGSMFGETETPETTRSNGEEVHFQTFESVEAEVPEEELEETEQQEPVKQIDTEPEVPEPEPEPEPEPMEQTKPEAEEPVRPDPEPAAPISPENDPEPESPIVEAPAEELEPVGIHYILNTRSRKFHYPSCGSVKKIKDENKGEFTGTRDELIAQGYEPCGNCHP